MCQHLSSILKMLPSSVCKGNMYEAIPPVIAKDSSTGPGDSLDTSFYTLPVNCEFWHCHFFENELLKFVTVNVASDNRLMKAITGPINKFLQSCCIGVDLRNCPRSAAPVTKWLTPTNDQYLLYCKLPVSLHLAD